MKIIAETHFQLSVTATDSFYDNRVFASDQLILNSASFDIKTFEMINCKVTKS